MVSIDYTWDTACVPSNASPDTKSIPRKVFGAVLGEMSPVTSVAADRQAQFPLAKFRGISRPTVKTYAFGASSMAQIHELQPRLVPLSLAVARTAIRVGSWIRCPATDVGIGEILGGRCHSGSLRRVEARQDQSSYRPSTLDSGRALKVVEDRLRAGFETKNKPSKRNNERKIYKSEINSYYRWREVEKHRSSACEATVPSSFVCRRARSATSRVISTSGSRTGGASPLPSTSD